MFFRSLVPSCFLNVSPNCRLNGLRCRQSAAHVCPALHHLWAFAHIVPSAWDALTVPAPPSPYA